jgi:hypothetical protein
LATTFGKVIFVIIAQYKWDFSGKKLRRRIIPQPVVTGYKVREELWK